MAPILAYWDIRGIVTPIRMVFAHANVRYEFKEYKLSNMDEWFKEDKVQLQETIDFPNLPYYVDGLVQLSHTKTILAYLGRKHNLTHTNETEEIRMSLILEEISDLRATLNKAAYPPMQAKNREEVGESLRKEFATNLPNKLKLISKFLGNDDWFAGKRLTYVDFAVYDILDIIRLLFDPKHLNAFQNLKDFMERVEQLQGVKDFLANKLERLPTHAPGYALFGNSKDYKPKD